jgi:hypothetical protein
MTDITVRLSSIDGFRKTRKFKTLDGARKFAVSYAGQSPEFGMGYAISDDGVCKITCDGCTLSELFGQKPEAGELTDREMEIALYGDGREVLYLPEYGQDHPAYGERLFNTKADDARHDAEYAAAAKRAEAAFPPDNYDDVPF